MFWNHILQVEALV
jgi:pyl_corrinoid: methyltransferase cognate corrinoid proteins, Methanosarcina family